MGLIKKLCNIIIVTVITTLTACKVQEVYNRYAYNDIAKAELKRKEEQRLRQENDKFSIAGGNPVVSY